MKTQRLRNQIKIQTIKFAEDKDWQMSFQRYNETATHHYMKDRLRFVEIWIKLLQTTMVSGILDPDASYKQAKKVARYKPSIDDFLFIRGVLVSHWKFGKDFLYMEDMAKKSNEERDEELLEQKRRYYFSKSEYELRKKKL